MFPNPHLVYLHDTPSHDLFEKAERAFSSGCIRVQNALDLAELLPIDPVKWGRQAIIHAIQSDRTQTVMLTNHTPALLLYWTAEAGEDGIVEFRNDLYGRDGKVLSGLRSHFRFHAGRNIPGNRRLGYFAPSFITDRMNDPLKRLRLVCGRNIH